MLYYTVARDLALMCLETLPITTSSRPAAVRMKDSAKAAPMAAQGNARMR